MGEAWKRIDLTGEKFGRLTAIKFVGTNKEKRAMWECKCECGARVTVCGKSLRSGNTKSCGCYNIEASTNRIVSINRKHGKTDTKLFRIWSGMKTRCYNKNAVNYSDYGGRGITVCDEWLKDFESFYEWSIDNGYFECSSRKECTLDRIDVNGNYCPENCRWVNMKKQQNNKRSNRIIEFNGESHTVAEWADIIGMSQDVLLSRLNSNTYTIERALTEPKNQRGKFARRRL